MLAWLIVASLLVVAAGSAVTYVVVRAGERPSALEPPPPQAFAPGSAAPGSTFYPIPDGALFVSRDGADEAPGTEAAPLRTVQQAVTLAIPGQTIVLREGSYHQRVTVTSDKPVTIQSYPGEEVWFDGSVVVAGWLPGDGVWVSEAWTTTFDSSPTFERGAPDNVEPGFNFLDPAYPLAAHPDQVWIDGEAQKQVADAAAVAEGTFAVDTATSRLYLGTDPTNREVRASAKTKAFGIQSENSLLRGIGVRRYATSVPGFGAVSIEAAGVTLENVVIESNATTGLFVGAANATVTNVTVSDNGMLGMGANYADGLRLSGLLATGNNTEHFNNAPVSGGFKITRSREVVVEKSQFSDNRGPGLWFDQSNFDAKIVGNTISKNLGHGLFLEISSSFAVAGNIISGNRDNGVKVNNTNNTQLWNNTITGNGRNLSIVQDNRRASDSAIPGHDPRSEGEPSMTWVVDDIVVSNNVFSGSTAECVVCVEDYSGEFTGAEMGVTLTANAYQRDSPESPRWLLVWSRGAGDPATFKTLATFAQKTGEERAGVELAHDAAANKSWLVNQDEAAAVTESARSIPAPIRTLLGWSSAVRRMGAY